MDMYMGATTESNSEVAKATTDVVSNISNAPTSKYIDDNKSLIFIGVAVLFIVLLSGK